MISVFTIDLTGRGGLEWQGMACTSGEILHQLSKGLLDWGEVGHNS